MKMTDYKYQINTLNIYANRSVFIRHRIKCFGFVDYNVLCFNSLNDSQCNALIGMFKN